MPGIPEDILDQIKSRADIVEVVGQFLPLKQRGSDFWGCCPFHHEKTPSFKVSSNFQGYYCFGCHASGGIFQFVQQVNNTDFVGAAHWLADYYHIDIPETSSQYGNAMESAEAAAKRQFRDKCLLLLESAAEFFHQNLLKAPDASIARTYLKERGRSEEAIRQFRLGFAPDSWDALTKWAEQQGYTKEHLLATGLAIENSNDNSRYYDRFRGRLMFPICNENGRVSGFSGRTLEAHPQSAKYVNSPETEFFQKKRLLYGLNFARPKLREIGFALICEGQMDVIACHQAGLIQAMASQGTAFTEDHAAILKKSVSKVRLSFDGDTAGIAATMKTIKLLLAAGLDVNVVSLPAGEDPDSIFRVGGAGALHQIIDKCEDAVPFAFRHSCLSHDLATPNGKKDIFFDVLDVICAIPDPVSRTAQCQWLAQKLSLPETVLLDAMGARLKENIRQQERENSWEQRRRQQNQSQNANNQNSQNTGGQVIYMPTLSGNSGEDQALKLILDLIVHYQFLADDLATRDYRKYLPQTPVGRAIDFLMSFHEQGEWSEGVAELPGSEMMSDPFVGQAIVNSETAVLSPEETTDPEIKRQRTEKLKIMLSDCLRKLQVASLSRTITQLFQQLQSSDETAATELLTKINQLQKQLTELKRSF